MNPSLTTILDGFKNSLTSAANQIAADVGIQTNNVRNAAADAIVEAGAGASIVAGAAVGAPNNVYTKIQAVGADWRTWLGLFVCILIVVYFIMRKRGK